MNFLKRLKFYLIGVGIGILMVMSIFKDRSFTSWTPKNQIKAAISNKPIDYNDWLDCKLNCLNIDTIMLKNKILEGKINYNESDVEDQNNRTYIIELEDEGINKVSIYISRDTLKFKEIDVSYLDCDCDD